MNENHPRGGLASAAKNTIGTKLQESAMRNVSKMRTVNDGTRSLFESVMLPEIVIALREWNSAAPECVLIGSLGLSYYVKPRMTQNIDVLMLSDSCIPDQVAGFRKMHPHAFRHDETNVGVNIVTPEHVAINPAIIQRVFATAVENDNIKIANPSGLVALKLFQNSIQAIADMVQLINTTKVDITGFELPPVGNERFLEASRIAEREKRQKSS
jgi:hypothetical protein